MLPSAAATSTAPPETVPAVPSPAVAPAAFGVKAAYHKPAYAFAATPLALKELPADTSARLNVVFAWLDWVRVKQLVQLVLPASRVPLALPPVELTRLSAMDPSVLTPHVPEISPPSSVKPNAAPVAANVMVPPPHPESQVARHTEPSKLNVAGVSVAVWFRIEVIVLVEGTLTVTPLLCSMLVCKAVKSVIWVASALGTAEAREPMLELIWMPCAVVVLIMCRNVASATALVPLGLDSPVNVLGLTSVTPPLELPASVADPSFTPSAVNVTVSPAANLKVPVESVVHGVPVAQPPEPVLVE